MCARRWTWGGGPLALAACLALSACRAWAQNPPEPSAESLFEAARQAQVSGDGERAETLYRDYLRRFPNSAEARANLGVLLARRGAFDDAIDQYRLALTIAPELHPLRLNLALAFLKMGSTAAALTELDAFLAAVPGNVQAMQLRAATLLDLERFVEAEAQYRALSEGGAADSGVMAGLGTALLRQGRLSEAREILAPIADRDGRPQLLLLLGQVLLAEGRATDAVPVLERASAVNAELPGLRLALGTAYWRKRRMTEAIAALRAAHRSDGNSFEAAVMLGSALALSPNDAAEAERLLRHAVTLQPGNAEALLQLGRLIWTARRDSQALTFADRALEAAPESRDALRLRAEVLRGLRRRDEAAAAAARAASLLDSDLARQAALLRVSGAEQPRSKSQSAEVAACRPCHTQRAAAQAQTPHAQAMRPWDGAGFAGREVREANGAVYTYSSSGVRTQRGGISREMPIRWAFGSGVQAVTPLIEAGDLLIEHRISWYRDQDRLALSPGHGQAPVATLDAMLGIEQTAENAGRCLGCHSTQPVGARQRQENAVGFARQPGVHCAACHGNAAGHLAKPGRGTIARDRSVALCAQCHRSPEAQFASAMPELADEASIRFAPVGFLASRCAQRRPSFTCVNCHDPHGEPAKRTVDQVCTGCHAAAAKDRDCPRSPGCASCHMPRSTPLLGLTFTDHRIR